MLTAGPVRIPVRNGVRKKTLCATKDTAKSVFSPRTRRFRREA
jgi:hypothetical protein